MARREQEVQEERSTKREITQRKDRRGRGRKGKGKLDRRDRRGREKILGNSTNGADSI